MYHTISVLLYDHTDNLSYFVHIPSVFQFQSVTLCTFMSFLALLPWQQGSKDMKRLALNNSRYKYFNQIFRINFVIYCTTFAQNNDIRQSEYSFDEIGSVKLGQTISLLGTRAI